MVGLVVVTEKEKWCNLRHHITVIIIIIIAQVKERSRHNAGDWNKGLKFKLWLALVRTG